MKELAAVSQNQEEQGALSFMASTTPEDENFREQRRVRNKTDGAFASLLIPDLSLLPVFQAEKPDTANCNTLVVVLKSARRRKSLSNYREFHAVASGLFIKRERPVFTDIVAGSTGDPAGRCRADFLSLSAASW